MSVILEPNTKETRKKLQDLARLQMITKLERDILFDLQVCELEGWDKTEFIRQLQDKLNSFSKNGE